MSPIRAARTSASAGAMQSTKELCTSEISRTKFTRVAWGHTMELNRFLGRMLTCPFQARYARLISRSYILADDVLIVATDGLWDVVSNSRGKYFCQNSKGNEILKLYVYLDDTD